MPELPEVETIARDLEKTILKQMICDVKVFDSLIIKGCTPDVFIKKLKNNTVCSVYRRGKAIIIGLSNDFFWIVQPMMTGQLVYIAPSDDVVILKETRIIVKLKNGGHVLYNDQRRFGHVSAVTDILTIKYFRIIGPEPLTDDFTLEHCTAIFKKSRRPVKNILLDHCEVAGIGNIYAAEILFRAHVSPLRAGNSITQIEVAAIYKQIRQVLQQAIKLRGSSMRNYRDGRGRKGRFNSMIQVYARQDLPCFSCAQPIQRVMLSGRSTFYCGKCQT